MNRSLLVLIAGLVLVVAACSADGAAATVNGVAIDGSELEGILDTGDEELSDERRRAVLTALVQWSAIADAAQEQFSIDPSEDDVAAYAAGILSSSGASANQEAFFREQGVTEKGFMLSANRLLVEERVVAELQQDISLLTEDEAAQVLVDDPASWTVVCAADIVVATMEEAEAAKARIDAGEDFGDVAAEVSLAPGAAASGGDLGCGLPVDWSEPIREAALAGEAGEIAGPFEADLGFHLLRIDSKTEATVEVVQQNFLRLESINALETWILDAITNADVEIASEYGTWSTDPVPAILPPSS